MSETKELLLYAWCFASTASAVVLFCHWRTAVRGYALMRDGWRESTKSHRKTLASIDSLATVRAERMVAEAALIDALKRGCKPEAKA